MMPDASADRGNLFWAPVSPHIPTLRDWPAKPRLSLDTKRLENQGFDAVIVLQNGRTIFEYYGPDAGPETPRSIKSITKPIVAATFAIAAENQPWGLTTPITAVDGCRVPEALRPLTAMQLLDMAAGLPWDDVIDPYLSDDWACAILAAPASPDAKGQFRYSGTQTQLAGQYLIDQTGRSLAHHVQTRLLGPIGAHIDYWNKQRRGPHLAGSDLVMGPADMLGFGELVLNKGVHQGRQIIPQSWIDRIYTGGITLEDGGTYSGGWRRRSYGGVPVLQASGYGGQQIVIIPQKGAVIVISGKNNLASEADFAQRGQRAREILRRILAQL